MNKTRLLTTAAAGLLAAGGMFAAATFAQEEAQTAAPSTTTVWVDGQGQKTFADKVNKMHAEMEGKGWKFGNLAIYTEDGDMQGAFVTYVR